MPLYAIYGDVDCTSVMHSVVGVFRNKQDAEEVCKVYNKVDLVILEFESRKKDSAYVWLLLGNCNRACLLDLSDDLAYLKSRQDIFVKIDRCDEDSLDYFRLEIGKVCDEKKLAMRQYGEENWGASSLDGTTHDTHK